MATNFRNFGLRPMQSSDGWEAAAKAFAQERAASREEKRYEQARDDRIRKENNENRKYQQEKFDESIRYDNAREDRLFTERHRIATENYNKDLENYKIAVEQIPSGNPEIIQKLNNQWNKVYKIPNRDGSFEERYVIPQASKDANEMLVSDKEEFEKQIDKWDNDELSVDEKIAAFPKLKRMNTNIGQNIDEYAKSYQRALSNKDNTKLLNTIGNFLPQGVSTDDWKKATDMLLKDGDVTEQELELISNYISQKMDSRDNAAKFWADFNTNVMDAMSGLKIDSDPSLVKNLTDLSNIARTNLDRYYPDISKISADRKTEISLDRKTSEQVGDEISQRLFGKTFDQLDEKEQSEVLTEYDNLPPEELAKLQANKASLVNVDGNKKEQEEEQVEEFKPPRRGGLFSRTGSFVKNPVTKGYSSPDDLGKKVKDSPFTYANKGYIPQDGWPGYKQVTVKEALQHYNKNKNKYKKDKPVKVSQGLFREPKDLTKQFPAYKSRFEAMKPE